MKTRVLHVVAALALTGAGALSAAKPKALFDGKTLEGWEGDAKIWRVQDGLLTGDALAEKLKHNDFLATKQSFGDFELKLKIKLTGTEGFVNSGIQIRSERVPQSSEMKGYQVDAGEGWWGKIYDESRRNKVIAEPKDAAAIKAAIKRDDWNDYRIRAEGPRIQTWINGTAAADYTEPDAAIPRSGRIGIQIHSGGKTMIQVKEITIEELPRPRAK